MVVGPPHVVVPPTEAGHSPGERAGRGRVGVGKRREDSGPSRLPAWTPDDTRVETFDEEQGRVGD